MKSTITDLWYGNLSICETCSANDNESKEYLKAMVQTEEALCAELNAEHRALFQKYIRWSGDYACCISALAFQDGFSLACKLLCEALAEN
jgi:hypothetical protein